ncbi:MAG: LysM peptidoglycan-binding domain-containing protein [Opitutales bacterium]|nr:LysM peptidoglycan-binding domain-containing protein [Opitutales bacterium]
MGELVLFVSMRLVSFLFVSFLLLSISWWGTGCFNQNDVEIGPEEQERSFLRGRQMLREGREGDALRDFLRVIDLRPGNAPESHLEAAEIYLSYLNDPVEAIYHYRRYLQQSPDSPQRELVQGRKLAAQREFARMLPARPGGIGSEERNELMQQIERLQRENEQLRNSLATARSERDRLISQLSNRERGDDDERTSTESREERSDRQEYRIHRVVPGDTLYGLSSQYYGNARHFRLILRANREVLPDENAILRPNMELRIPPPPQ